MPPRPDPRWDNFIGGLLPSGLVRPMSFEVLEELSTDWALILPTSLPIDGPPALLKTARSLFVHAWFDYEFMVVACLVAFQGLEAAFHVLYPDADDRTPFRHLVNRAKEDGVLSPNIADLDETAVELRNLLAHPATQGAFTIGIAGSMLENTHRLVAEMLTSATT
jgi:hypothetical protein